MLKDMLKMLTDALTKNPASNIGKIMFVFNQQYEDVQNTLQTMREWVDVDKAEGKELDAIGTDINQPRGLANDKQYRMMIRSKRARAQSDGTWNAIINTMAKTLNCKPTDLSFKSVIEKGGTEPLALVIEKIPLKTVIDAQITTNQLIAFVEQVAPCDVRVAEANFEGTFRFSSKYDEPEYNTDYGFGKGTLSLIVVPSTDVTLPI